MPNGRAISVVGPHVASGHRMIVRVGEWRAHCRAASTPAQGLHSIADKVGRLSARQWDCQVDGDDPVVIHAMALRRKFYRFLA